MPCLHRLQLRKGEQGDVVAIGAIAVIILVLWRLCNGRKQLQRNIAILQARQIHMAARHAVVDIAVPH